MQAMERIYSLDVSQSLTNDAMKGPEDSERHGGGRTKQELDGGKEREEGQNKLGDI